MWDVTQCLWFGRAGGRKISTHTSRVRCDATLNCSFRLSIYFYSHIPCEMWQRIHSNHCKRIKFLLTHPVWDVTIVFVNSARHTYISTHTSRVRCDAFGKSGSPVLTYFYSHIPCEMWRWRFLPEYSRQGDFYSHIPCEMWPLYIVYYSLNIPIYHKMDL